MANNFSTDPSVKALWRFEPGALTVDSIGTNTLSLKNTPTADTNSPMEGGASLLVTHASDNGVYITDANLSAGFPLKSGDTTKQITICGRFKPTAQQGGVVVAKFSNDNAKDSFMLVANYSTWSLGWGNGNKFIWDFVGFGSISNGVEYDWAVVIDGVAATAQVRINGVNYTHQFADQIAVGASDFIIGNLNINNSAIDGHIDEVVVFNRLLSDAEIDAIRSGAFGGSIDLWFTASLAVASLGVNSELSVVGSYRPLVHSGGVLEELQQGNWLNLDNILSTPVGLSRGDLWVDLSEGQRVIRLADTTGGVLMADAIDPGHKHTRLWNPAGSAASMYVGADHGVYIGNPADMYGGAALEVVGWAYVYPGIYIGNTSAWESYVCIVSYSDCTEIQCVGSVVYPPLLLQPGGGYVGIRTDVPLADLHVTEPAYDTPAVLLSDGLGTTSNFLIDGYSGLLTINAKNTDNVYHITLINEDKGKCGIYIDSYNSLQFYHENSSGVNTGYNYLLPYGGFACSVSGHQPVGLWMSSGLLCLGLLNLVTPASNVTELCIDPVHHRVGIGMGTTTLTSVLQVAGLGEHADNAAALTAGKTAGAFYRTGDSLKVVH